MQAIKDSVNDAYLIAGGAARKYETDTKEKECLRTQCLEERV